VNAINVGDYRRIVVLTGAGVSAASGLPTYRGTGGLWNTHDVEEYATGEAVRANPRGVWEFFARMRALVAKASPNPAHPALARLERRLTFGRA
jgi:NAD-dependent deacetylase